METTTWTIKVAQPEATVSLRDLFGSYLLEKQVGGLMDESMRAYRNVTKDFLSFAGDIGADQVTTSLLKSYFATIFERDYARATILQRHAILSDFSRWLVEAGHVAQNPMIGIKRVKSRQKLPRVLSEADTRRLLFACGRDFNGIRLRAIIMMFLGTGIRVSELAVLRVGSLDFEQNLLRVKGKGGKERIVPVSKTLKDELEGWLGARRAFLETRGVKSESLFVGMRGNCPHRASIERQLKRLCKRAGVSPISPHVLRHTFATRFAEGNGGPPGNLWHLQQILGHSDISTTQIYVKVSAKQVQEKFRDPLRLFTS